MRDLAFGTLDEALEAAHADDPPADPDAWMDQDEFRRETEAPPQPGGAKAQVVSVSSSPTRLEPAAVEVAVVMAVPSSRFVHRRMRCYAPDLPSALPHLYHPDPDVLVHGGEPSAPRWVQDWAFGTTQRAMQAAQDYDPPADPAGWLEANEFRSDIENADPGYTTMGPQAERVGPMGRVVVGAASLTAFVAVFVAAILLDIETDSDASGESVFGVVSIVGLIAAGLVGYPLAVVLARRNLAREIARRGPQDVAPSYQPRESGPTSRGPTAARVQDGPSAAHLLVAGSVDTPQDTPDTLTPQDD